MANGKKGRKIVCRSEKEFEELFLPRSHERKRREKGLSEPGLFEIQLARDLHECLQKAGERSKSPAERTRPRS
ncbi:MAG: hypothetical protein EHJ95_00030 [Methanobacteriota archaeon]|nr:MAG: hypothetical protein EHJ95_02080 [Euryarchaeota archaeon]RPJ54498.1 MAG: hypothetical protein EHJ95_00030 [Euryarchaeota archaeon]